MPAHGAQRSASRVTGIPGFGVRSRDFPEWCKQIEVKNTFLTIHHEEEDDIRREQSAPPQLSACEIVTQSSTAVEGAALWVALRRAVFRGRGRSNARAMPSSHIDRKCSRRAACRNASTRGVTRAARQSGRSRRGQSSSCSCSSARSSGRSSSGSCGRPTSSNSGSSGSWSTSGCRVSRSVRSTSSGSSGALVESLACGSRQPSVCRGTPPVAQWNPLGVNPTDRMVGEPGPPLVEEDEVDRSSEDDGCVEECIEQGEEENSPDLDEEEQKVDEYEHQGEQDNIEQESTQHSLLRVVESRSSKSTLPFPQITPAKFEVKVSNRFGAFDHIDVFDPEETLEEFNIDCLSSHVEMEDIRELETEDKGSGSCSPNSPMSSSSVPDTNREQLPRDRSVDNAIEVHHRDRSESDLRQREIVNEARNSCIPRLGSPTETDTCEMANDSKEHDQADAHENSTSTPAIELRSRRKKPRQKRRKRSIGKISFEPLANDEADCKMPISDASETYKTYNGDQEEVDWQYRAVNVQDNSLHSRHLPTNLPMPTDFEQQNRQKHSTRQTFGVDAERSLCHDVRPETGDNHSTTETEADSKIQQNRQKHSTRQTFGVDAERSLCDDVRPETGDNHSTTETEAGSKMQQNRQKHSTRQTFGVDAERSLCDDVRPEAGDNHSTTETEADSKMQQNRQKHSTRQTFGVDAERSLCDAVRPETGDNHSTTGTEADSKLERAEHELRHELQAQEPSSENPLHDANSAVNTTGRSRKQRRQKRNAPPISRAQELDASTDVRSSPSSHQNLGKPTSEGETPSQDSQVRRDPRCPAGDVDKELPLPPMNAEVTDDAKRVRAPLSDQKAKLLAMMTARMHEGPTLRYMRKNELRKLILAVPIDASVPECSDMLDVMLGMVVHCEASESLDTGWGIGTIIAPREIAEQQGGFRCIGMRPILVEVRSNRFGNELEWAHSSWDQVKHLQASSTQSRLRQKALLNRLKVVRERCEAKTGG